MQTFKFEELTDPAKEKARQWYATNTDNHWAEYVIESAKEEGLKRGFNIADVFWCGFGSQSDGASWIGNIDIRKFLEYHLLEPHIKPDNPLVGRYAVLVDLLNEEWLGSRMAVTQRSYHYVHSGGMLVEEIDLYTPQPVRMEWGILAGALVTELFESFDIESLCDHLQEWALDEAKSYADDIYKQLEKEYDYEISDEHIQETASINEWRFDEDGCIV